MEKDIRLLSENSKCKPIFAKYHLSEKDIEEIFNVVKDIFFHEEFQRKLTDEFPHHNDTSLGEHIMEVTVVTYFIIQKYHLNVNLENALIIAMLHDMYTKPWQNSGVKRSYFFHRHGFAHPIEASINVCYWFSFLFKTPEGKLDLSKSDVILDGIIHHMFCLPVMSFDISLFNKYEINNHERLEKININLLRIILYSCRRHRINKWDISLCPSKYLEGNIVSLADKYVTVKQLGNIQSTIPLVTGNNESIKKGEKTSSKGKVLTEKRKTIK